MSSSFILMSMLHILPPSTPTPNPTGGGHLHHDAHGREPRRAHRHHPAEHPPGSVHVLSVSFCVRVGRWEHGSCLACPSPLHVHPINRLTPSTIYERNLPQSPPSAPSAPAPAAATRSSSPTTWPASARRRAARRASRRRGTSGRCSAGAYCSRVVGVCICGLIRGVRLTPTIPPPQPPPNPKTLHTPPSSPINNKHPPPHQVLLPPAGGGP